MLRRKRTLSPPAKRFCALFPSTLGPHQQDVDIDVHVETYKGASPRTTANLESLRKQLFKRSMSTEDLRSLCGRKIPAPAASTSTMNLEENIPPIQDIQLDEAPRGDPPERTPPRRCPAPPDQEDVAFHIATAIERALDPRKAAPAPAGPNNVFRPPDIPLHPTFNWRSIVMPAETNIPVHCNIYNKLSRDSLLCPPVINKRQSSC